MSYNYFRNLKRQTQVDNRPKYLRYGDVFLSNKNNINNNQQNKYNNSNQYDNIDYSKYNNKNSSQYENIDYSKYNNKNSSQYDNIDYSKYNNENSSQCDNNNYQRYSGRNSSSYAPNFSTTTATREQINDFDAANIDIVRTTNQINRNSRNKSSEKYNSEDDDLYSNIDYINYNTTNDYLNPNRSRKQQTYNSDTSDAYNNYFFNSNNSKVNYQKRQLPPLQQKYSSRNSQYDLQYDNKYWEDYDPYQSKHNKKKADTSLSFKFIWHKFIITFTSILSIVCIAWITYHWHSTANSESNKNNNIPELIEPDKPSFKVLPDTPGGIEIPYQDKSIYNRVDPTFNQKVQENLRASQEVPVDISAIPITTNIDTKAATIDNKSVTSVNTTPVEEYSIVEERDYYVKCPIDGDKTVAIKQLNLLKKKLLTFPDSDMLENTTCSIRTVANTQGIRGKFILIGPFCDDNTAKQIGHFCKIKGEIISVKKSNRN